MFCSCSSCECKSKLKELRVTSYEGRGTSYELRVTSYEVRIASDESWWFFKMEVPGFVGRGLVCYLFRWLSLLNRCLSSSETTKLTVAPTQARKLVWTRSSRCWLQRMHVKVPPNVPAVVPVSRGKMFCIGIINFPCRWLPGLPPKLHRPQP